MTELRLCGGLLDQITTDGLSFTDKIASDISGLLAVYWSLTVQMKEVVSHNAGNKIETGSLCMFYSLTCRLVPDLFYLASTGRYIESKPIKHNRVCLR